MNKLVSSGWPHSLNPGHLDLLLTQGCALPALSPGLGIEDSGSRRATQDPPGLQILLCRVGRKVAACGW